MDEMTLRLRCKAVRIPLKLTDRNKNKCRICGDGLWMDGGIT